MHHLIVFVPSSHSEAIRKALAEAGAGKLGNYDSSSFTTKGVGRFRPIDGARPAIGTVGKLEEVEEERIEVMVSPDVDLKIVVAAIKKVHPYEEPAIYVLPMVEQ